MADTYIALFSHFIPCGVWEAIYILDRNGLTLPTSRAIRPQLRSFEHGTRSKARHSQCSAGCRNAAQDPDLVRVLSGRFVVNPS